MEKYQEKYEEWCNNSAFDEETKEALAKMKAMKKQIKLDKT